MGTGVKTRKLTGATFNGPFDKTIKGAWLKPWQRCLRNYNVANGLFVDPKFHFNGSWDKATQRMAVAANLHAGHTVRLTELQPLRDIIKVYLDKNPIPAGDFVPKIIDVRDGKLGFVRRGTWDKRNMDSAIRVVGHYTGGLGTLQADARYHVYSNGWTALSYHFAVDRAGTLYWVNDVDCLTWHAKGLNLHGIGISFVGDAGGPTADQELTLHWFIEKAVTVGIPELGVPVVKEYTTHRHAENIDWRDSTDCPGDVGESFYASIAPAKWNPKPTYS